MSPVGGDVAAVAIETATETVGVAVRTPDGVEAEFALTGRRRHVETLTPALEHVLGQVGLVPGDLGVVAVDIGPGLFTGLRVGVAAAKGLAQALGIGVLCATSLDILTAAAAEVVDGVAVLACVDARRGEVFAAVRRSDHGETMAEPLAPALWSPGGPRSRPRPPGRVTAVRRGRRSAAIPGGLVGSARGPGRLAGTLVPATVDTSPARPGAARARGGASRRLVGRSSVHA